MAVSAVLRCGQKIGRGRLINHLLGQAKDSFDEELSTQSTYGSGKNMPKQGWSRVFDALLYDGVLAEGGEMNRPAMIVPDAEAARALFRGERTLMLRADPAATRKRSKGKSRVAAQALADMSERDQALFDSLRTWRTETAKTRGVPPYVIFHDRTLAEIARERPTDADELRLINGVGEKKAQRYAADVSRIVSEAA
jgi:ATP-dependent DNA helicase RecQ